MFTNILLIGAVLAVIGVTFWAVVRSRDFRKFLAGAFFVSAGVQVYLAAAKVAIPVLGTTIVQTPQMSLIRATVHGLLCVTMLYFGFFPKNQRLSNVCISRNLFSYLVL